MLRTTFPIIRAAKAALFILSVCLCFVAESTAAISLTVAPPYIEKIARPGSRISDVIMFRNGGTEPMNVSVSFVDFGVNEDGTVREKPPGTDSASILPFTQISPLRARVRPNEEIIFHYTVNAPKEFRQLRTMIMFAGMPEVEAKGNQVVLAPRVGIPLYVESTSARPAFLEVSDVQFTRSAEAKDAIDLSMNIRNAGDRNLRSTGTVRVRSSDARFDHTFEFNEGHEPVLPGQRRKWTMTFRPVSEEALSVSVRFATSFRDTFSGQYRVAAALP